MRAVSTWCQCLYGWWYTPNALSLYLGRGDVRLTYRSAPYFLLSLMDLISAGVT